MTFINGSAVAEEAGWVSFGRSGARQSVHSRPNSALPGHKKRAKTAPPSAMRIQGTPKAAPSGAAFAHYASKISALWVAFAGYASPDKHPKRPGSTPSGRWSG